MQPNEGERGDVQTYAFQAEINQLLSLIINTFYSNKEVWLRELLSNASDALDKARYKSLVEPSSNMSYSSVENDFRIRIECDKTNHTVSITDTGIGMTKADLVQNLGTIARSGTKGFMEALSAGAADVSMIGQFGVGFYSSYLVADNVTVITKHPDDDHYVWSSQAGGSFTIAKDSERRLSRGTRVVLHLKEDQSEYLQEARIRELVRKHSEFIGYPIELLVEKQTDDEQQEQQREENDEESATRIRTVQEWELLNRTKPIWMRPAEDVSSEEYAGFYKNLSSDWEGPLAVKHFSAEGQLEFKGLLFVPPRAPFDLFEAHEQHQRKPRNLRLYVRRVFVTDSCEDLLPDYLTFVRGVVDSEDLPLNISRETLQQSSVLKVIRKTLVKKCLEMFSDVAARGADEYARFYEAFGKHIKLGVHGDAQNRAKLAEFMRFHSSRTYTGGGGDGEHENDGDAESPDARDMTSLRDYVTRMREGQPGIFYVTGESNKAVRKSPFLERLKCKGYEVLYMTDPIDEYVFQVLREFEGKRFIDCTKEGLPLEDDSDEERVARERLTSDFQPVCARVKEVLGARVEKVVVSHRIVDSPCVLVTGEYGWSANMERIMKAQVMQDGSLAGLMVSKKTMEINPVHPLVREVKRLSDAVVEGSGDGNYDDRTFKDLCLVMFETALLTSGFAMDDPHTYAARVYRMLCVGLSLEEDDSMDDASRLPKNEKKAATDDHRADQETSNMEEID